MCNVSSFCDRISEILIKMQIIFCIVEDASNQACHVKKYFAFYPYPVKGGPSMFLDPPPPLWPRTFSKKSPPQAKKFWGPFFEKFDGFWEKINGF